MTEEFDRARLVRVIEQGKQTVERIAVALGYRSSTLADMAFTEAELGQLT